MPRPRPDEEAVREQLKEVAPEEPQPQVATPPEVTGTQGGDAPPEVTGTQGGDEPEAAPEPKREEDPLQKAERERGEYLELSQRTRAELENYRKRAAREAAKAGERAKANLVRELLPVLDNLERALASAGDDEQHLADGVRMVHAQLVAALERDGIEAFDPAGDTFDPECHEALSTREEGESGRVLDVVEKGYKLNGTVLRPARVVVSA
jgi:molecular chaperone GrpE